MDIVLSYNNLKDNSLDLCLFSKTSDDTWTAMVSCVTTYYLQHANKNDTQVYYYHSYSNIVSNDIKYVPELVSQILEASIVI